MAGEVEGWAAISPEGRLAEALEARSAVLAGGARTREAALAPRNPGGLSPGFRAVLAARIAAHHGEVEIAEHYRAATAEADARPADPGFLGDGNARLQAVLRHVDLVTLGPKDAVAGDIQALRAAGLAEADIVRLSELIAFLAYELRLVAGLRLLGGES